jgi:hypothetical protein
MTRGLLAIPLLVAIGFSLSAKAEVNYDTYNQCFLGLQAFSGSCGHGQWIALNQQAPFDADAVHIDAKREGRAGRYIFSKSGVTFFGYPLKYAPGTTHLFVVHEVRDDGKSHDLHCNLETRGLAYNWCRTTTPEHEAKFWTMQAHYNRIAGPLESEEHAGKRLQEADTVQARDAKGQEATDAYLAKMLSCARDAFHAQPKPAKPGETETQYLERNGLGPCVQVDDGRFLSRLKSSLGIDTLLPNANAGKTDAKAKAPIRLELPKDPGIIQPQ